MAGRLIVYRESRSGRGFAAKRLALAELERALAAPPDERRARLRRLLRTVLNRVPGAEAAELAKDLVDVMDEGPATA